MFYKKFWTLTQSFDLIYGNTIEKTSHNRTVYAAPAVARLGLRTLCAQLGLRFV